MAASFAAAVVKTNRPLWALVCRFNCRLAADVHPSHLGHDFDSALFKRLCRSPRAGAQLSDWIVRQFQLDPGGHWDFMETRLRLALLPIETLERLTRLLGLAALHRDVAHVVRGPQIRALRESLGDADYEFAVKRASLLVRQIPAELKPQSLIDDAVRQVADHGQRALAWCLSGAPQAVIERLALKLPPNSQLHVQSPPSTDAMETVCRLAHRIIAFEVAPELAPCFN